MKTTENNDHDVELQNDQKISEDLVNVDLDYIPNFPSNQTYVSPNIKNLSLIGIGCPQNFFPINNLNVTTEEKRYFQLLVDENLNCLMTTLDWNGSVKDGNNTILFPNIKKALKVAKEKGLILIIRLWIPSIKNINTKYDDENYRYDKAEVGCPHQWKDWIKAWYKLVNNLKTIEKDLNHYEHGETYTSYIGGYCLCDEPSAAIFGMLAKCKEAIMSCYEPNEQVPVIYTNLYGKGAPLELLNGYEVKPLEEDENSPLGFTVPTEKLKLVSSIEEYYSLYQQIFKPAVWCYDVYPFEREGGVATGKIKLREGYFSAIKAIKSFANSSNRPYWAYTNSKQEVIFNPKGQDLYYAEKTLATLRFEAFTQIAFGAKGFNYWTMYSELTKNNDGEVLTVPIISDGKGGFKTTDIYDIIQQVNEEIMIKSPYISEFNTVRVGCYPAPIIDGDEGIDVINPSDNNPFGLLTSIASFNKGVIVSQMKRSNSELYIVVNQDLESKQIVWLKFSKKMNVLGQTGTNTEFYQELEPGGWCILRS